MPPAGRSWRASKEKYFEMVADNRIWFGPDGNAVPSVKRFLTEVKDGITSLTLWTYQEVGHNQDARKEVLEFNRQNPFETPKPEPLIERILTLGSNPNDLVLDSFLGSGTTCAVAHKMGRRYIGIELGEHAYTHCKVRLDKVIDGEQGGISKAVGWQGGGGYEFYTLAPSLINIDKNGIAVISPEYNAEMLAAAMCKHENYVYSPDSDMMWKQGWSGESKKVSKNYIFTTTGAVTLEYLDGIAMELTKDENLKIFAKSFNPVCKKRHKNISINKIPSVLLGRCEYGKTDYNLNVIEQITADSDDWLGEEQGEFS
jgi:adenine-specific DNA-methyltransferase